MKHCQYCNKAFTFTHHSQVYCGKSCAAKARCQDAGQLWPTESEAWLEKKVGTMPLGDLATAYNREAIKQKWPERTQMAIKMKLIRLGWSVRPTEDNLSRGELAKILGISRDRVKRWTMTGLPYRRLSRSTTAIRARDVRAYLLSKPHLAADIPEANLAWLIGEDAAHQICSAEHSLKGRPRPVVNLTTGHTYPGIKAAARVHYLSHSSIRKAILRGGLSGDYEWAYQDELEDRA
jgi:hypothetical protein